MTIAKPQDETTPWPPNAEGRCGVLSFLSLPPKDFFTSRSEGARNREKPCDSDHGFFTVIQVARRCR